MIDLKDQFDQYLRLGFLGNREFEQRIQLDFSHFINLSSKSAEYLSLYIDEKLRKGLKVSNENDIGTTQNCKYIEIFVFNASILS